MNRNLPGELAQRLLHPLPGWKAQARYQPELSFGRHLGPAPPSARPAAVLVLLYEHDERWHVPLIVRPAHMVDHASQVSFPGGAIEPGEDSRQAALREYSEELGAPAGEVEVLGELSPLYLFASNFHLSPWVGVLHNAPIWNPSPGEVHQLLEVPLEHLIDPANLSNMQRTQRGLSYIAPSITWQDQSIWGATCMVLSELIASLEGLAI